MIEAYRFLNTIIKKPHTQMQHWYPINKSECFQKENSYNLSAEQRSMLRRLCAWYNDELAAKVQYATHDRTSTAWPSSWGLGSKRDGGLEIFTEGRGGFLREKMLEERRDSSQVKCVGDLL
jgi:hypothetical protein